MSHNGRLILEDSTPADIQLLNSCDNVIPISHPQENYFIALFPPPRPYETERINKVVFYSEKWLMKRKDKKYFSLRKIQF